MPRVHEQLASGKQLQQCMADASGGALQAAVGLSDKTVDAWAGEITNKWRVLIAQRQKASGDAGQGADSLQSLRGKADHRGVAKEENLAPSATVGRSTCFLLVHAAISLLLIHSALFLMTHFLSVQENLSQKTSAYLSQCVILWHSGSRSDAVSSVSPTKASV